MCVCQTLRVTFGEGAFQTQKLLLDSELPHRVLFRISLVNHPSERACVCGEDYDTIRMSSDPDAVVVRVEESEIMIKCL